jgi:hypothetical protein
VARKTRLVSRRESDPQTSNMGTTEEFKKTEFMKEKNKQTGGCRGGKAAQTTDGYVVL